MAMAYRYRPRPVARHAGEPDDGMDRYRELLAPRMGWVIGGAAVVMGLFAGASATGQWRSYSLWRHSQEFGTTDPYFNKDAGFYVFDLPWWHYIVDFVMALAVDRPDRLAAGATTSSAASGSPPVPASGSPAPRRSRSPRCWRCSCWPRRWTTGSTASTWSPTPASIFTGMGYTDDKAVLPAKEILAGIAMVCALLFLANIWRRTWLLPSVGVALFALSAIILGLIVPTRRPGDPGQPQRARP